MLCSCCEEYRRLTHLQRSAIGGAHAVDLRLVNRRPSPLFLRHQNRAAIRTTAGVPVKLGASSPQHHARGGRGAPSRTIDNADARWVDALAGPFVGE